MNSESRHKLENQLCFALYACSREITRMYTPLLDELGVTYPQYLVLLVLWEEGEATVKELGERLFLDSGTLTPMLKRMEASGILTRTRSSLDERSVVIQLTDQGRKLEKRGACIPDQLLTRVDGDQEEADLLLRQVRGLLMTVNKLNRSAKDS
ncbi:MarR family winged helix-turn-helix transcriptional regulator [Paenibacillus sp. FJAT-26967]|uniref:MarR family winged helix-turn-helix transcriptional regulator n=1 Tax=Paenibacillus sp. FJAT-26967 TaxID=1729690 RepID=UPI00083940F6|nr:MarR family transcriptional regulator [Paenibacillus sp. FJAT-26967]